MMTSVTPKGLPGGDDCCTPWAKIMQRLRELETGLSQRVKKVKVNGQTIYPVNDGEIILPDYPEGGGDVQSVSVGDTKYLPDEEGDVGLPAYPPDVSADVDALEIEVGSLDSRLESVEDDVGTIGFAVIGLGDRLTTAEGDIDDLDTRVGATEGSIDGLDGRLDDAEGDIDALEGRMDLAEQDVSAILTDLPNKPYMHTGAADPDEETIGRVGDFYLNTTSNDLFQCKAVSPGEYTWEMVGGSSGSALPIELWRSDYTSLTDGTTTMTNAEFNTYMSNKTDDERKNVAVYYQKYGLAKFDRIESGISVFKFGPHHTESATGAYANYLAIPEIRIQTNSSTIASGQMYWEGQTEKFITNTGGTIASGYSFTIPSNYGRLKEVTLSPELYNKYVSGDVTVTVDTSGRGVVTVVNGYTVTERTSIYYTLCGFEGWTPLVVTKYGTIQNRPVVDFEKGGSGGASPLPDVWVCTAKDASGSFTNGSTTYTGAEFYTYLTSLSYDERKKVNVIDGTGQMHGLMAYYTEYSGSYVIFQGGMFKYTALTGFPKRFPFYRLMVQSNGYVSLDISEESDEALMLADNYVNIGYTSSSAKSISGTFNLTYSKNAMMVILPDFVYDEYKAGNVSLAISGENIRISIPSPITMPANYGNANAYAITCRRSLGTILVTKLPKSDGDRAFVPME